jgi:serine/threonine protein kinase
VSLVCQVQWNRRLGDGVEILRRISAEIMKFHDEDRVVGILNPSDIYIDGQVITIRRLESDSDVKWSSYDTENTKERDIFSLGCLFYFVLSGGQHPFGDNSRHQLMSKNLFLLKACKEIHSRKLIERMINFDPNKRPTIEEVCDHPMFWEPSQIVAFLKEYSKKMGTDEELRNAIEISSAEVLQSSTIAQVKRRKKVDVKSISDILNEIKVTDNDSDVLYWHKMFPNLLPAVYLATEDSQVTDEYHPTTRRSLLIASHCFDDVKLERKAKQIKLRPGRYGNKYVNVIVASKSDEDLQHYLTVLNEMFHINHANVLPLLFSDDELDIW